MAELFKRLSDAWAVLPADECFSYLEAANKILGCDLKVPNHKRISNDKFEDYQEDFVELSSEVDDEFISSSGHTIGNLARMIGISKNLSYSEILNDCLDHLKINAKNASNFKKEEAIAQCYLDALWRKLPNKEKEKLQKEIYKHVDYKESFEKSLKSGAAIGTILIGKGLGFSLYIGASTALSAVSSALGLGLPFAAYTGMSAGIAALLGPLGWTLAGVWSVYQFGSPSYEKKIIPTIILLFTIRTRIDTFEG